MANLERYFKNITPFLEFYTQNPIASIYDLFGQELWWGQRKIIRAIWKASYNLIIAARGVGKTRILAVSACLRAMLLPGEKVVCTAASYRQSRIIFQEVEQLYDSCPIIKQSCKRAPVREPDSCRLIFNHGSSITAVPLGSGDKIRGLRAHTLLIDEAAQVPEEIINDVLFPMMNAEKDPMQNVKRVALIEKMKLAGLDTTEVESLSGNHCVIMSSTAYFRFNHLYKIQQDWTRQAIINPQYSTHSFTYLDPPKGFINMETVEMEKHSQGVTKFMMEHLSVFPDEDAMSFFPAHMVSKMRSLNCPILFNGKDGGTYVIGIDPARTSDNLTICVLKVEGELFQVVYLKAFNNVSYTYASIFLRQLISMFNPAVVATDKGGGGMAIYDELNKYISQDYLDKNVPENDKVIDINKVQILGPIDLIQNRYSEEMSEDLKNGRTFLIDLKVFTSEWIAESYFKMRSKIFTAMPSIIVPAVVNDAMYETMDAEQYDIVLEEIIGLVDEMQNIKMVPTRSGNNLQFLARDKRIRRDRCTALLIAVRAALDLNAEAGKQQEVVDSLSDGFWL